jgi:hypothetical protein
MHHELPLCRRQSPDGLADTSIQPPNVRTSQPSSRSPRRRRRTRCRRLAARPVAGWRAGSRSFACRCAGTTARWLVEHPTPARPVSDRSAGRAHRGMRRVEHSRRPERDARRSSRRRAFAQRRANRSASCGNAPVSTRCWRSADSGRAPPRRHRAGSRRVPDVDFHTGHRLDSHCLLWQLKDGLLWRQYTGSTAALRAKAAVLAAELG